MEDLLRARWNEMRELARLRDDFYRDRESSRVPPILGALVIAAEATTLRRFHPFTSHAKLRFSVGPRHDRGTIAPALISLTAAGAYEVWDHRSGSVTVVCTTTDPADAAAELERILADWPG